ncbi:hypothetical protein GYB22_12380 [bacterium]|nr:hypothetical protein [bacterium]
MQSNDIIEVLENKESKDFIIRHLNDDIRSLALKKESKSVQKITQVLQLMGLYQRAGSKLPSFIECLPALTEKAYMQASSERVARYKSGLIKGESLLDLSAGLGIDDIAFSKTFKQITAVDFDPIVHEMAVYNLNKLGVQNIVRVCDDAKNQIIGKYDWVYLDPDRRPGGSRVLSLTDMEPKVQELIPELKKICNKVWIKLSPLFEVKEVLQQFEHVKEIVVISERNEVKEVGVYLKFDQNEKPKIRAVDLGQGVFQYEVKNELKPEHLNLKIDDLVRNFLFIPFNVLVKAHADTEYCLAHGLQPHPEFNLYFDSEYKAIEGIRTYKILKQGPLKVKEWKQYFKDQNISLANLVLKGSKDRSQWYKKLGITEGGNDILFVLHGKTKEAIFCRNVTN